MMMMMTMMMVVLYVDNRCIPMLLPFRHTTLRLQLTALHIRCTPFLLLINHTTASQRSRCLYHRGHLLLMVRASQLQQWVSHSTTYLHKVWLVVVVATSLIQCQEDLLPTRHQRCPHSTRHRHRCTCHHQRHQHHSSHSLELLSISRTVCRVSVVITR